MLRNVLILLALIAFVAVLMDGMMEKVAQLPPHGAQAVSASGQALSAGTVSGEPQIQRSDGTFVVRPGPGGHHQVEAIVNNQPFNLMVDTGASKLTLSRGDAEKLGIDLYSLNFSQRVMTANGTIRVAPLTLDRVEVGPISIDDVNAIVLDTDLSISLLGMSFLKRLAGFEVRDGNLIMRY